MNLALLPEDVSLGDCHYAYGYSIYRTSCRRIGAEVDYNDTVVVVLCVGTPSISLMSVAGGPK